MAITIDGVAYYSATEMVAELGISRQTLWRWRQERKIPSGHRFRGRRVLFTAREVEQIRLFANRVEPIDASENGQRPLFGSPHAGGSHAGRGR